MILSNHIYIVLSRLKLITDMNMSITVIFNFQLTNCIPFVFICFDLDRFYFIFDIFCFDSCSSFRLLFIFFWTLNFERVWLRLRKDHLFLVVTILWNLFKEHRNMTFSNDKNMYTVYVLRCSWVFLGIQLNKHLTIKTENDNCFHHYHQQEEKELAIKCKTWNNVFFYIYIFVNII